METEAKALIFIGSSIEGLEEARRICELLSDEDTECMLWTKAFLPGFLTFESLENMLLECCAAVFVATPDDEGTIRGTKLRMPRANILLEFGLVAGRLGRHNIALCQYGCAELPSDLKGLTVIKMDPDASAPPNINKDEFRQRAFQELRSWSSCWLLRRNGLHEQILCMAIQAVGGSTHSWRFGGACQSRFPAMRLLMDSLISQSTKRGRTGGDLPMGA
jgi:Predicted nucleotide-binding protein containing TIR-like domain